MSWWLLGGAKAVAFGKASPEPMPEALYTNVYSSNKEGFEARGVDHLGYKTLL